MSRHRTKEPLPFDECGSCANKYTPFCQRCTMGQFYREKIPEMNIDEFGFDSTENRGRRDD